MRKPLLCMYLSGHGHGCSRAPKRCFHLNSLTVSPCWQNAAPALNPCNTSPDIRNFSASIFWSRLTCSFHAPKRSYWLNPSWTGLDPVHAKQARNSHPAHCKSSMWGRAREPSRLLLHPTCPKPKFRLWISPRLPWRSRKPTRCVSGFSPECALSFPTFYSLRISRLRLLVSWT